MKNSGSSYQILLYKLSKDVTIRKSEDGLYMKGGEI
jgi:hypothetical protein